MQRARKKTVKRGRPAASKPAVPLRMREHILDHAEALFARHGLYGVTVREVARSAEVDSALVHYYFETKQGLFGAVFERRAAVLNAERMRSMDAYERAAGDRMTVEGCIEAFLEPILRHAEQHDTRWRNYFRLIAAVNNAPDWGGEMMTQHFDPVIRRLVELIRKCLPHASDADLFWSYHFLSGALTLSFSETGRIDRLSDGACLSSDMKSLYARMVPFIAAGFEKVCRTKPPA